jgi:hypothetical protein
MASYGDVLARNIRGARARLGIGQESAAARMRALGHHGWIRQTVSSTEKATRRVTAHEVFCLALALETSISALTTATADDEAVALPGGSVSFRSVEKLATGFNDHAVQWKDDTPVFSAGKSGWFEGDPDAPDLGGILHQGDED